MKVDIKIRTFDSKFKYRVSGILIHNNKLLVVKMGANNYYNLPGGHVELGEFSIDSVVREFKEEVNTPIKVIKPIAITESIFRNKRGVKNHELAIIYLLEKTEDLLIPTTDYNIIENDNGKKKKLYFKWIEIDDLYNYNFRPQEIVKQLINENYELHHYTSPN